MTINSFEECFVLANIDVEQFDNQNILFHPYKDKLCEKGLLGVSSLHCSNNKSFYVRLYNVSDIDVKLNKGLKIGCAEVFNDNKSELDMNSEVYVRQCEAENVSHLNDIFNDIINSKVLTSVQKKTAIQLIKSFSDVFSQNPHDIGLYTKYKHCIKTNDNTPIAFPIRRIPTAVEHKVDKIISEMLDKEIIRESNSPWCAPVVIVPKKNNDIRLCIDYRGLNFKTERPIYPIPEPQELFDTLEGSKFFSSLDLSQGYYNVEIEENDKSKTAFATRRGQFEFNRLAMGLCSGPATFQKIMNLILKKRKLSKVPNIPR